MTGGLRTYGRGGAPRRGVEAGGQSGPAPFPSYPRRTHYLEWRSTWTLEVGFMDEDHRALAAMLNRLARDYGVSSGLPGDPIPYPGAPPLQEALEELAQHTRAHFQREEEVMRNDGFPGLSDHKSEHDQLLAELSMLARGIRQSGRQRLDAELLDSLKDWFLGHVLEQDRELAEFLKGAGRPVEGGPGL